MASRSTVHRHARVMAGLCRECARQREGQYKTRCNQCGFIARVKAAERRGSDGWHEGSPGRKPKVLEDTDEKACI